MKCLLFLPFLFSGGITGHEALSPWETARKSDKVVLQYRWLNVGDSLKTREMRILFSVRAPHGNVVRNLKEAKQVKEWSIGLREFKTYNVSDNSWVAYSLYDIPRPFPQQDLVTAYKVYNQRGNTVINISAMPGFKEKLPQVKRLEHFKGKWVLHPATNGETPVEFYSISYTAPMLPRFIQDPILQRLLIRSIETFICIAEQEDTLPK